MVSGVIAERIKPVLDTIIHGDQKGFVSGRYIGEAVRTTYDIMQWAKENNKVGLILLIDFEKAYDSVSFCYIEKCLRFFNFGDSIISWIGMLLNNFTSVINLCGNLSERFNINRGCRQGDPIASFLFIICIEVLAHKLRTDGSVEGFEIGNLCHLLELYADDCSIFLSPTDESLRKAISILNNFFKLSGLKISVSKTKAIWFGAGSNYTHKLCPDLPLVWGSEFRLLGIDFDSNLAHMEANFDSKLDEIRKVLNCWFYRSLTPYGKITVIKTLALPKLSHAALVIPSLKKNKLKELEQIIYKFMWGNKPDKVNRDTTKLPEKAGGLGMIDLKDFWSALKFSWFRRLLSTSAFWPKVLELNVSRALETDLTISDIVHFGPSTFTLVGKKMSNLFWKEVFGSVQAVMKGALFCSPEKILLSSFWGNPAVTRNNKPIKATNFPNLALKIKDVADFFIPGTNQICTKASLELKCNTILDENSYIEIKYILKSCVEGLGLQLERLPIVHLPSQPLLVNIATLTRTGCSSYYKLLRKHQNLRSSQADREAKWHTELNTVYGIPFWNRSYSFTASIRNDNKIKWMNYQIVRNCQFSNYRVNKFKPNVSPLCTYCQTTNEKLSHLYFHCNKVQDFWIELQNWFAQYNTNIPIRISTILFGLEKESPDSVINYTILVAKRYIWTNKFNSTPLSFIAFRNTLKKKLNELKDMLEYKDELVYFDQWLHLYDFL